MSNQTHKKIYRSMVLGSGLLALLAPKAPAMAMGGSSSSHTTTASDRLNSAVSSTMRQTLPNIQVPAPANMAYPAPGELALGSTRTCGDADASFFASSTPAVQWLGGDAATMDTVVGYWAAPAGSAPQYPQTVSSTGQSTGNAGIWIPVVTYHNFKVAANSAVNAGNWANHTGTAQPADTLLQKELANVMNIAAPGAYVLPGQPATAYNLYVAAMACVNFQDSYTTPTSNTPTASEITSSLSGSVATVASSVSGNVANALSTTGLGSMQSTYSLSYNSAASTPSNSNLVLNYPASGTNQIGAARNLASAQVQSSLWQNAVALSALAITSNFGSSGNSWTGSNPPSYGTYVVNLLKAMKSQTSCQKALRSVDSTLEPVRWFETFPLQLACKALDPGGAWAQSVNNVFNSDGTLKSTTVPASVGDVDNIMSALMTAAILEDAQNYMASSSSPTPSALGRCFVPDGSTHGVGMISTILNSAMIPLDVVNGKVKPVAVQPLSHPEGLFAILFYGEGYLGNSERAVFGMTTTMPPIANISSFTPPGAACSQADSNGNASATNVSYTAPTVTVGSNTLNLKPSFSYAMKCTGPGVTNGNVTAYPNPLANALQINPGSTANATVDATFMSAPIQVGYVIRSFAGSANTSCLITTCQRDEIEDLIASLRARAGS